MIALYSRLLHDEGVVLLQQVVAHHRVLWNELVGDGLVDLPDDLHPVNVDKVDQHRQQALVVFLELSESLTKRDVRCRSLRVLKCSIQLN